MGFATGPVASDGPLGDSVVVRNAGKWVLGAGAGGHAARNGAADPIPVARPFRTG
jgi:hypothetical protein